MIVKAGSQDVTTYFVLRKAADGTALTSATITNIDLCYTRSGADHVNVVDATALGTPDAAHADNKAIEVDSTAAPGLYRVDWPDAAFLTGTREVILTVIYATAFTEHLRVELTPAAADLTNILGTALTETSGGLIAAAFKKFFDKSSPTGTVNSLPDVVPGSNGGLPVLSATLAIKANLTEILGTALTETSGYLATSFKKFFNVLNPTGTVNSIPDAVAGATGGLFIAGTNAATSITTALTTTFTGNLTGSVGSLGTTAKAEVNAEVDAALDTAIPATPTADSINERVKAIDTKLPSKSYLTGSNNSDGDVQADEATGNFGGSVASVAGAVASVTAGVTLANDAISAAKFDENTAFPLTSADTAATRVARTGGDNDTLETLSDQLDSIGGGGTVVLTDGSLTAAKFDGSTAFPLTSADTGSTAVARTGADGDTLETLSDQIDGIGGQAGAGAISHTVTINDGDGNPIDGVAVWVTTDSSGSNTVASGSTNALGKVTFMLDAGSYYCWKHLAGFNFINPETLTVS